MDFNGKINEFGKLKLFNRSDLDNWIEQHKGQSIVLSVKSVKKKRSNDQNAYYWGVCVPLVQEAMNGFGNNFTKDVVHEFLKKEFNFKEVEANEGNFIKVPDSTTDMTTTAFMDYILKIQQFAIDVLGIYIPDPNEQLLIHS